MKRALIWVASFAALWTTACGGGGTVIAPPPPDNGFSKSSLQGQYAFSMSGTDGNSGNPFTRVGSFIADGNGAITGGVEDVFLFGSGTSRLVFTGGNYTVNTDGRGTMTLINVTGTLTFSITLTSPSSGYVVDMPTDGLAAGNGSFVKQSTASFLTSAVSGSYAFDLSGVDANGTPESVVGQFVSNGTGTLSGIADDNDGATVNGGTPGPATISGTYAADGLNTSDLSSFGRGVFAIGGITGVFYIVGPNQVKFIETNSGGTLLGDAQLQSNIPTTAAGISGGFVYAMGGGAGGNTGVVPLTRGGKFSASSGGLSKIILDTNNAGQTDSLTAASGTYTIDAAGTGRGTVTFQIQGQPRPTNFVFYLLSPTQGFIQDQTFNIVEDGSLLAQGTGTISDSTLAGIYAINWSGVSTASNSSGEEDLVGQVTLNGGNLTGAIDLNEFATDLQFTTVPVSGSLKLDADPTSHNTFTINLLNNPPSNNITAFAYIANNNTILFMGTQKNVRIMVGILAPQNP